MLTLIIYDSKRGGTQQVAERISNNLTHRNTLCSIKDVVPTQLSMYDQVLFVAPTYAGNLRKTATDFLHTHQSLFNETRFFLVNTGIQFEEEKIRTQLETVFSEELRKQARLTVFIGGISCIPKMNFFEKMILKKIFSDNYLSFDPKRNYEKLHTDKLKQLIHLMNGEE